MGLACNLAASFLSAATYGEGGQVSGAARRRFYYALASRGDARGSVFHRLSSICSSYRRTAQGEQGCSHTHCIDCPSSSRKRYEQEVESETARCSAGRREARGRRVFELQETPKPVLEPCALEHELDSFHHRNVYARRASLNRGGRQSPIGGGAAFVRHWRRARACMCRST